MRHYLPVDVIRPVSLYDFWEFSLFSILSALFFWVGLPQMLQDWSITVQGSIQCIIVVMRYVILPPRRRYTPCVVMWFLAVFNLSPLLFYQCYGEVWPISGKLFTSTNKHPSLNHPLGSIMAVEMTLKCWPMRGSEAAGARRAPTLPGFEGPKLLARRAK